ncbi:hypothetical protein GOBAR_AA16029 [Gossypium barbadense]|uniref:non-specific serine/threonine protein kinase n=1 Tax=Gossypium barbadense TaxID=3634 RepID=A0A2P5XMT3_GOSBA|nr:hypothetical protein GOBAR_AA16029 [Gossypium barbadense]
MAIEDDAESCGSRAVDSLVHVNPRHHRQKLDVFHQVLNRIRHSNYAEANLPGFDNHLWLHFNRLPARLSTEYGIYNIHSSSGCHLPSVYPVFPAQSIDSVHSDSSMQEDAQSAYHSYRQGIHPPPTFGSSSNLEAVALQARIYHVEDGGSAVNSTSGPFRPMHEITFSTVDRPKLLSQFTSLDVVEISFTVDRYALDVNVEREEDVLTHKRLLHLAEDPANRPVFEVRMVQLTSLLAEIGLNIQEAHAFSTTDGYSLDVFVVDGWPSEEIEELKNALEKEISKSKLQEQSYSRKSSVMTEHVKERVVSLPSCVEIPTDGTDVWEIDARQLKIENRIASGSYADLYRGTYCSQEVAIKVLKPEQITREMLREFSQEVYIMKIRHKNVVQLIGACTRSPNLCIVTEFMARGSIYDYLHKQRGVFKLPSLLKVAVDVSKGMNYLHQNNIIHRDLKTANLLMDENQVADEGEDGCNIKSSDAFFSAVKRRML